MNIAILDDYQNALPSLACFARLAGHQVAVWNEHVEDPDVLATRLAHTEVLILIRERMPISAALLERLPALRLISQFGATPHIDLAACTRRGVLVCSAQFSRPSHATAEFTWGLVIAAMRRIPQEAARLKAGGWQSSICLGLHGRTLGIYGFGRIGAVVAGYGRAFGMRVLVWGRDTTLARARAEGYQPAASRQEFFEQSDVLSLHMRLTGETRGIVSATDLALMKPTALLVNTSRAGLIVTGALESALRSGRPGMAAVDVFEDEPVRDASDPLLALDNALCTPHLGYVERDAYEFGFGHVFDQVAAYVAGAPVNVINPGVLEGPALRHAGN